MTDHTENSPALTEEAGANTADGSSERPRPVAPTRRAGFLSRDTWKARPVLAGSIGALGVVLALGVLSGLSDDDDNRKHAETTVIAILPDGSGLEGADLEDLLSDAGADRRSADSGDDDRSPWMDDQERDQTDGNDGAPDPETPVNPEP